MDQLANAAVYLHLVQVTPDGGKSSDVSLGSPPLSASSKNLMPRLLTRRLNPHFAGFLMGWPRRWTSAIVRPNSNASEMELYRSKLDMHLSSLLGDLESLEK